MNGHVANDYKQALIEVGICSPSATCSCVVCMRKKSEFHWLSEMLQKHRQWPACVPGPKDAAKREGRLSFTACNKRLVDETGAGVFNLPGKMETTSTVENGSVFYPPLIDIPWRKLNGGICHMPGGIINRFFAEIRVFLRMLGNESDWMKLAQDVYDNQLPAMLNLVTVDGKQTPEYQRLYNENKRLQLKAQMARVRARQLMNEVEEDGSTEDDEMFSPAEQAASEATRSAIAAAEKLAQEALNDCHNHASVQTKFAHLNLCKRGVELIEPMLKAYLSDKCKKPREMSEHVLNNAMRANGAKFEKQNSGWDMSTQNGMNTVGKFSNIAEIVEAVYPVTHPYHNTIKQTFAKYRRVAVTLAKLAAYMKSQELRKLEDYLPILNDFIWAWEDAGLRNTNKLKTYFLKLHHTMAHSPEFVKLYGMLGRVSEESFEALHALIAQIKSMVRTMHGDVKKIESANAKAQTRLKRQVIEVDNTIVASVKRTKRTGVKSTRQEKAVAAQMELFKVTRVDGEDFIDIDNGKARIKKEWEELYLMISCGKVPLSWTKPFDDSNLSDSIKQEASISIY